MTIGNYNLNQIWLQLSKYQQQINLLVVVVLSVYLLAFLAELTWRLLPQPDQADTTSLTLTSANRPVLPNGNSLNLNKLQQLNLFGDASAEPVIAQQVTEAPETSLNLTLHGVVASTDPSVAAAIVENRGNQNVYGINDKIEGTNALLKEVFADRVIIKNGPRRETLMLDGINFEKNNQGNSNRLQPSNRVATNAPSTRPAPVRRTLSEDALEATRELQNSPGEFTDKIAISPYQRDGMLIGYQVSPGKEPALFEEAGFKAGDIVTEINGLDLTDPQQALEAMDALREVNSMQMTVTRGDEVLTLYLDFP